MVTQLTEGFVFFFYNFRIVMALHKRVTAVGVKAVTLQAYQLTAGGDDDDDDEIRAPLVLSPSQAICQ